MTVTRNMKTKILIPLCLALSFCVEVYAEGDSEIRRGTYPFMAILYYPHETVADGSGTRFLRGAVLIQPNWLITSAVGPSIQNNGNGFPQKTLLARAGAISIDGNFTLNEDEDEQEREIIQIIRPYNHSATQWWHTDISLMKTLLPFNTTSAVAITMLTNRPEYAEKTCTVLIFAKSEGNSTEDRHLMQLKVELLPPSVENCGPHYQPKVMTCAADTEESKNAVYDPNFCQDNRGGPLICEDEVIGLQTYIENKCKQPYLYQLLSSWDNLISCGTDDKCNEEQCSKICDITYKDPTPPDADSEVTAAKEVNTVNESAPTSEGIITHQVSYETTTDSESPVPTTTLTSEESSVSENSPAETTTTTTERAYVSNTYAAQVADVAASAGTRTSLQDNTSTSIWPHQKHPDFRKTPEPDLMRPNRKPKVEAQLHDIKKPRSSGQTNALHRSIFFVYFILASLI